MTDSALNSILLVDDEPDIRTVASFALENVGQFKVKSCSSGYEALTEIQIFLPDLILLDVMMSGMDGIETFHAIRKINTFNHIPIIFMTAKAQANEVAEYKKMGVLDVIVKPFNAMTLAKNLREMWSGYYEQRCSS